MELKPSTQDNGATADEEEVPEREAATDGKAPDPEPASEHPPELLGD
jgi:hypothetical protein